MARVGRDLGIYGRFSTGERDASKILTTMGLFL